MRIAVVEPDELLADLVSFRLQLLGHQITNWHGGRELLSRIDETTVDLLLIDIYQPDMPGWEAILKVRATHTAEQLPILALSVDTDLSLVEQAYKAGANDYLITPFDPATLQRKTDALLLKKHLVAK